MTDDDLAVPGVLNEVAATADGFVAVGGRIDGTRPTPDTLVPAAWRSADGREWEPLDLGGVLAGADDHLGDGLAAVAADGERVVVASGAGVWLSPDEGDTWEAVEMPEPDGADGSVGDIEGLRRAVHGTDGFLLVGVTGGDLEGSRVLAWTSPDGEAWAPASPPEGLLDGVGFPVVAATPHGFLVGGVTLIEASVDPAPCYTDIVVCGEIRGVVAALEDNRWSLLDTSGAGQPASWRPEALAVSGDDLVVVARGDGLKVWRHDLAALRRLEPVEPPAPAGPPLVESGAQLEVGRTYRYPLYVHCGAGYLGKFNGRHWFAVPGEGIDDRELYEAGLPIVQDNLFGEMTVVSEDRISTGPPASWSGPTTRNPTSPPGVSDLPRTVDVAPTPAAERAAHCEEPELNTGPGRPRTGPRAWSARYRRRRALNATSPEGCSGFQHGHLRARALQAAPPG